ncbi:MAG: hypothetical protein LBV47_06520 [Bacteroidales bacterium]|jgi:hypothetical protein|nr:hypothetical protein [Bacteroidales bacterium]
MITKEEYIAAMAIVEAYYEQVKAAMSTTKDINLFREPTIQDFLDNVDISMRLRNFLTGVVEQNNGNSVRLKNIREFDMAIARNMGQASVKEFVEKRDRFLNEWQP